MGNAWWNFTGITFYGEHSCIVKYDPTKAHFMSLPLIPWTPWFRGTFLGVPFIWLQLALWITYMTVVAHIDQAGADVLRRTQAVVDIQPLVNFLLGLFVSLVITRWWAMRTLYQTVMGRSADTAMLAASYILPAEEKDRKLCDDVRKRIIRYVNLAHALMVSQYADKFEPERLIEKGLLLEEEWETIQDEPVKWVLAYVWAASLIRWCAERNMMVDPEVMLPLFQKNISKMRGAAGDIGAYVNSQLPLCYIQLLSTAVYLALFVLMNSLSKVEFMTRYFDGASARKTQLYFWPYLLNTKWVICYDGLLVLQWLFENPFRRTAASFPTDKHIDDVWANMLDIISQAEVQPFPNPFIGERPLILPQDNLELVSNTISQDVDVKDHLSWLTGLVLHENPLRIMRYRPEWTSYLSVLLLVPLTPWYQGTFFGTAHLWMTLIFWVSLLSWWGFSDDPVARTLRLPNAIDISEVAAMFNATDPDVAKLRTAAYSDCVAAMSGSFSKVQKLAIFLLGFYVSLVLSRWWNARETYQIVWGRSKDLAVLISAYIHTKSEMNQSKVTHVQMKLVRYINLAHALVLQQAKGSFNEEGMIRSGIVTQEEWMILKDRKAKYVVVQVWMLTLLRWSAENGFVTNEKMLNRMIKTIEKIRGAAGDLLGLHLAVQMPWCYVQLVSYTVHIFLFVFVCQQAQLIDFAKSSNGVHKTAGYFWTYFVLITTVVAYEGFLLLHIFLCNPFGDTAFDFPLEKFTHDLWKDTVHTIMQPGHLPFEDSTELGRGARRGTVIAVKGKQEELTLGADSVWARWMGVLVQKKPMRIVLYMPWKVHLFSMIPLFPLTPWWRGTILANWRFYFVICFWTGWLSWVGFTDNDVAVLLREVQSPTNIHSLVTFLLSMAVTLYLTRWWSMREKYEVMLGGTYEIAMLSTAFFRPPPDESVPTATNHVSNIQKRIVRYCNLGQRLLIENARDQWETNTLVEEGLATRSEWEILRPTHIRWTVVYLWVATLVRWSADNGMMIQSRMVMNRMQSCLSKMRCSAGDVLSLIFTQIPFAYVQVINWCILVYFFMLSCWMANKLYEGQAKEGRYKAMNYLWSYMEVILRVSVFSGIPIFFAYVDNPFAKASPSFAVEKNSMDLITDSNALLTEDNALPVEGQPEPASLAKEAKSTLRWYNCWDWWFNVSGVSLTYQPLRILKYETWKLHFIAAIPFLMWTPSYKGSYLGTRFMWMMLILWTGYVSYIGWSTDPLAETLRLCVPDSRTVANATDCSKWSADTISNVQNLTNFLVGLFITLVVTRWWRMRELYQVMRGNTVDLSLLTGIYIRSTSPEQDAEVMQLRTRIIRLFNLAHGLVLQQAAVSGWHRMVDRKQVLKMPFMKSTYFIDTGIVSKEEWQMLEPLSVRYVVVYKWVLEILNECAEKGYMAFPDSMFQRFTAQINKMRDSANLILLHLDTQLPLSYIHMLSFVIHVFLVFQCSFLGHKLSAARYQSLTRDKAFGIFWVYFSTLTWVASFEGLFVLNVYLNNPFGWRAAHFPTENYINTLWKLTQALIGPLPEHLEDESTFATLTHRRQSMVMATRKKHAPGYWRKKFFGMELRRRPFAVVKYRSEIVNCGPFFPLTPWFRGTFFNSLLLWGHLVLWCGLLSYAGFSTDPVASAFRNIEPALPTTIFNLIVFLLGLYVSLVLGRWWRMRTLHQTMFGVSMDTALMAAVYIDAPSMSMMKEVQQIRKEVVRYLNLAHCLCMQQAGAEIKSEDLMDRQLLLPEEWGILKNLGNKFVVVYMWLARLLCQSAECGFMFRPAMMLPRFQMNVSKIRGASSDIFMFLDCQLPYCYIQLLSFAVHVFMFSVTCLTAAYVRSSMDNPSYTKVTRTGTVFWGYLELCILTMSFEGLLVLNCMLTNPWEDLSGRFPTDMFIDGMVNGTKSVLKQADNLPSQSLQPSGAPGSPPNTPSLVDVDVANAIWSGVGGHKFNAGPYAGPSMSRLPALSSLPMLPPSPQNPPAPPTTPASLSSFVVDSSVIWSC